MPESDTQNPESQNQTVEKTTEVKNTGLSIKMILIVAIGSFLLLFGGGAAIAVPLAFLGLVDPGEPSPIAAIFGDKSANGCYLEDDGFIKTDQIFNSPDDIIQKLSEAHQNRLKNKRDQLQKIIDTGKNTTITALLVSIWAGEETFGNDEKAFGCGIYEGSKDRNPGFDAQLGCAIDKVKKAMTNTEPYNKPAGVNIFTRLFYTYTGAMQTNYHRYGYVAGDKNPRIVILKQLVPNQVTCKAISKTGSSNNDKIVGIARGQVGYKTQKPDCAIYNEKTIDESRQYQWCVSFVSWVYRKAGHNVPRMVGTEEIMNYFKNEQMWIERKDIKSADDIRAGDVLIETSASSNSGKHAGIIDIENGRYFTIEGNTSRDMVERREIGDMNTFVRNLIGLGRMKE